MNRMFALLRMLPRGALWCLTLALALPVLTLLASWLAFSATTAEVWTHLAQHVLPAYLGTSLWLCLCVGVGVVLLGTLTATTVSLFEFRFKATLEWCLLLPMAFPAYVVAYAYTDFLQFSGPLQSWMREVWGLEGRLLPEIRSLSGAVMVLTLSLYPYVYLLTRTALSQRASHLMEAARLMGVSLPMRIVRVALPMARPAIAAGAALALMETLSDFGVSSYFGIQTFTVGIYKAWLVMDNREAAAQLSTVLLALAALVLMLEQRAQARLRFASSRADRKGQESKPLQLDGTQAVAAWVVCLLPVVLGFVLPLLLLLRALWAGWDGLDIGAARFYQWTFNSFSLGLVTAVLAVAMAWMVTAQARLHPGLATRWAERTLGLGYAVPGVVIVVGLLLPVGWLQTHWPSAGVGGWLTASVLGLIWAYLVRFVAVALQSLNSGYARIPPNLDDSSRILGVYGWHLMWRVHAPLLAKPALAATLLVMVDVMKELPATLVLRPFNTDTLAVMTYQLARDERLAEASLPALMLVLVGLLPVILLSKALKADRDE
jgi:iron(III) transport system permease protein